MKEIAEVLVVAVNIHMVFVQEMAYDRDRISVVITLGCRMQCCAQQRVSASSNEMIEKINIAV